MNARSRLTEVDLARMGLMPRSLDRFCNAPLRGCPTCEDIGHCEHHAHGPIHWAEDARRLIADNVRRDQGFAALLALINTELSPAEFAWLESRWLEVARPRVAAARRRAVRRVA